MLTMVWPLGAPVAAVGLGDLETPETLGPRALAQLGENVEADVLALVIIGTVAFQMG